MNDGFQTRRGGHIVLRVLAYVALTIVISNDSILRAQELAWPLPGVEPDILIGAEYAFDTFDRFYTPMHQGRVYGGLRGSSGAYLLKLAGGKRFGQTGFQGEIEAYPLLGKGMYAYASYAYGETPVYPRHRVGLEVYRGLPWSLEGSIGARYFALPNNKSVILGTGSLTYYWGRFLFTVKPFVSLNTPKISAAGVFTTRYYLSDNEEYLTGRVGAGFTPDERWIQSVPGISGQQTTLLQSQTVGAAIQKIVMRKLMFLGQVDVTRQEVIFSPGTYVIDAAIGIGFRMLL